MLRGFLRRPASRLARRQHQRQTRNASGANVPDIAHNVNEYFSWHFYAAFATIPVLTVLYQYSRPGPNGEMHWITRKVFEYQVEMRDEWRDRNVARTQAFERAAHDKHLLLYGNEGKHAFHETRFPDALWAGCTRNAPAGHFINIDHVVEHYRQKHLESEAKKAERLAAKEAPAGTDAGSAAS